MSARGQWLARTRYRQCLNRGSGSTPTLPLATGMRVPVSSCESGHGGPQFKGCSLDPVPCQDRHEETAAKGCGEGHGGCFRLRYRGRRIGRMRAGQPVERGRREPRPPAGGGRPGPSLLYADPGRLHEHRERRRGPVDLRQRTRAATRQPAHVAAARQGAGWFVVDQRHDVHTRQRPGLRQLGRHGCGRLGLRRCPALLPPLRDLREGR